MDRNIEEEDTYLFYGSSGLKFHLDHKAAYGIHLLLNVPGDNADVIEKVDTNLLIQKVQMQKQLKDLDTRNG